MPTILPRQPDVFIVGAPKSGTTALHTYLRQHPDIFFPARKDPPYFATDLEFRRGRLTLSDYATDLYPGVGTAVLGHTSVWYLYSRSAAQEIFEAAPAAKIIIMLRNPVEMMYAQHSQFLYNGNENIPRFSDAVAAEPDRVRGRRIPRRAHFPQGLQYTDTARYAVQVERYLTTFPVENVRIILYDDFAADPSATTSAIESWLGVSPSSRTGLPIINPNKRVKYSRLQAFLMAPPPPLEKAFYALTPRSIHGRLAPWLIRRNTRHVTRAPIPANVHRALLDELEDDMRQLSHLLGRDLAAWLTSSR